MPGAQAPFHPRWKDLMDHFIANYHPAFNPQASVQQYAPQLAQVANRFPEPQQVDNPPAGAEVPFEQRLLSNLNALGSGYQTAQLAGGIGSKMLGAGEAGAFFPQTQQSLSELPVMQPGSRTGDPHALFAYNDNFGPNGSTRAIYNVYGDPAHPAIQARGWGSSVSAQDLQKAGIPIIGRQPNAVGVSPAQ